MKKILSILLVAVMLSAMIAALAVPTAAQLVTATEDTFDPNDDQPKISTAADLEQFYQSMWATGYDFKGKTVTLEADIVLNEDITSAEWYNKDGVKKLVPSDEHNWPMYRGAFDGKGHTIQGIIIDGGDGASGFFGIGLFTNPHQTTIKNFTIDGFYVTGDGAASVGVVAARVSSSVLFSNISVKNGTVKVDNFAAARPNSYEVGCGVFVGHANLSYTNINVEPELASTLAFTNCIVEDDVNVVTEGICGGIAGSIYTNVANVIKENVGGQETFTDGMHLDLTASAITPAASEKTDATALLPVGRFLVKDADLLNEKMYVLNGSNDYEGVFDLSESDAEPDDEHKDRTFTSKMTELVLASGSYGSAYVALDEFAVTWVIDGTSYTENYTVGAIPDCKQPTDKAMTDTTIYIFDGWVEGEPVAVSADATYTAKYKEYKRVNVTWSVDGVTTTEVYKEGDVPKYENETTKAADDDYVYTFKGWDKSIAVATEGVTYTAVYNKKAKYDITWVIDGKETKEIYLEGVKPNYKGKVEKAEDDENKYEFTGWDKEIVAANGDVTYTAQFKATPKNPAADTGISGETGGCGAMMSVGLVTVFTIGLAGAVVARKKGD